MRIKKMINRIKKELILLENDILKFIPRSNSIISKNFAKRLS